MTGLALGVAHLPNPLPISVTQLQNGISAAVVGLVAQAGTSLSKKIVIDKPTLLIATIAAAAESLYSAPWLEPVIIAIGGILSLLFIRFTEPVKHWGTKRFTKSKRKAAPEIDSDVELNNSSNDAMVPPGTDPAQAADPEPAKAVSSQGHVPMSWQAAISVFAITIILLIAFMALKNTTAEIRPLAVLMQFYVAGCVIFGGGPVVIPLLYSYVVAPGWASNRDFALGVALIQAMPGPNFNFAAYCGCLALSPWGPGAAIGGALLGYVGIFTPGLALNAASIPLWQRVRKNKIINDVLPGMNAAAVGLVYAAAYLLWEKGIVRGDLVEPLGSIPYYAVVAGCAFVLVNAGVQTPIVMILGALAGLVGLGLNV
ncbi:hypothetical protein HDV00_011483 [Rhizophlyctis rosea]|nr:hypothetical protein HDV00_011483 [Rhizophlyctis rosea]